MVAPHCQLMLRLNADTYDLNALLSDQAKEVQSENIKRTIFGQFVKFSGKDISIFRHHCSREAYLGAGQIIGDLGFADELIDDVNIGS